MKTGVTRILVDGPAWVGDMVMAQTLFKLLRNHHPDAVIDVLAPEWTKALLDAMPEVNNSIALPIGHGKLGLIERYQIAKRLRNQQYDWAIVLRNSFKSALIPFWARIPRRTGWLGEMRFGLLNDARRLNPKKYPLMIERFMALGLPAGATLPKPYAKPSFKIDAISQKQTLARLKLNINQAPILVLCPGAEYGPAKRWPAEYFAEVAKAKLAEGWQVWLLGSAKDKDITLIIDVLCDHRTQNLAGKTTLAEAIELLAVANLVIANDSGLMHIAAALERNLIVMYGSSSPTFTPPSSAKAKLLSLKLECSPCFARECPLGHLNCLRQLTPELVLQATTNFLDEVRESACLPL